MEERLQDADLAAYAVEEGMTPLASLMSIPA